MKHALLVLLCSLALLSARAADDWKVYYQNAGITISYRYADCNDAANGIQQQKVFLKFASAAAQDVKITFDRKLQYDGQAISSGDHAYEVVLKAGETREGNCETRDKAFYIFSKQLNTEGSVLKTFILSSIIVKPIN